MLDILNLTLGYSGKPVLQFNDLQLVRGGQCLITGPSGSGKTTLLYAIAGLVDVIGGHIAVSGTDITKMSEAQRDRFRGQHIGIVFQTLHLVKSLTVMENLMLAAYVAGSRQDRRYAMDVLRELGIEDKANALPQQLSQGQAQRVAIARAVLNRPQLLLADEPTSSLDDQSCSAVIRLLQKVASEHNASLVISTHDSRVKAHFDHIVTLGGGL